MKYSAPFLVSLLAGFFLSSSSWAAAPTLKITKPLESEAIEGYIVEVRFETSGLVLKDNREGLANVPGQGHINFWLDPKDLTQDPPRRWFRVTPYTFADVSTGDHVLVVELVGNDDQPLEPKVSQTVKFKTKSSDTEGSSSQSNDGKSIQPAAATNYPTGKADPLPRTLLPLVVGGVALLLGIVGIFILRRS